MIHLCKFTVQKDWRSWRIALMIALAAGVASINVAQPSRAAADTSPPPPPPTLVLNLDLYYGIQVAPSSAISPAVPATDAIQASIDGFDYLGGDSPAAYLVSYSDPQYGDITSDDDTTITPAFATRTAWLVVLHNSTVPLFRPPGKPGPDEEVATLAVFVDADTGEVVGAVALPPVV